jgi:hypothetical protein
MMDPHGTLKSSTVASSSHHHMQQQQQQAAAQQQAMMRTKVNKIEGKGGRKLAHPLII